MHVPQSAAHDELRQPELPYFLVSSTELPRRPPLQLDKTIPQFDQCLTLNTSDTCRLLQLTSVLKRAFFKLPLLDQYNSNWQISLRKSLAENSEFGTHTDALKQIPPSHLTSQLVVDESQDVCPCHWYEVRTTMETVEGPGTFLEGWPSDILLVFH